jgi:hypothetical protein
MQWNDKKQKIPNENRILYKFLDSNIMIIPGLPTFFSSHTLATWLVLEQKQEHVKN